MGKLYCKHLLKIAILTSGMALVASASLAADISGFRSAKFKQDEKAVRESARKDLAVSDNQIVRSYSAATGATVLSVPLKSMEPFETATKVDYVLGVKCKCLIRVAVEWQMPAGAESEARQRALAAWAALVEKFAGQPWPHGKTIINQVLGKPTIGAELPVIFFRGQDGKAGVSLIGFNGKVEKAAAPPAVATDKQSQPQAFNINVDSITTVQLIYDLDVEVPDLFSFKLDSF